MIARENNLTLPHPLAHLRAFVMIPWLAVDPDAQLTVAEGPRPVAALLAELDPADREASGCPADARRPASRSRSGIEKLMGPTRKRDLTAAVVGAAVLGYLLVMVLYRWFPPITVWTGLSLLAVAIAEALWARYVRAKISEGEIGDGPGWLHPLAVARTVMVAKASAWVGALVLGWWVGVLGVLSAAPVVAAGRRRGHHRHGGGGRQRAGAGGRRAVAAALLQSPQDPPEHGEGAES